MTTRECRFISALGAVMILTLWYALTPSRETRAYVADKSFRTNDEGESRRKFRLSLALEEGKTYRIEETTRHTATTRNAKSFAKNTYEVFAQTEYLTTVSIDFYVESVRGDEITCKATLQDFVGYDEVKDMRSKELIRDQGDDDDDDGEDGGESEQDRKNRNKQMFSKIREETRGVQFKVVLGPTGIVQEMDTSKLRERIISALHEVGQLPMHLEHAVLIGGYDVYPANGASFGPQGRTSVRAPVYRMKGTGCDEKHPAYKKAVRGKILIVDRGDCTFNKKAQLAAKADAAALIVIDLESKEGAVMTYMSGEADVPIVSIIVNKDAGKAMEDEMTLKADYTELPNGDKTASDRYLVEILGGVEAVQALNEVDTENDDDVDDEGAIKKRRSHNYNPLHSDGLHDFVGIGYVVDEVIRTRFSIFPDQAVNIGSSWERTLYMSDGIDPTVRAEVKEKYKLLSVAKAEHQLLPQVNKGDLIAEIEVSARERPHTPKDSKDGIERLPINPEPGEEVDESKKVTPQFARPSFRGHEFKTKGIFYVHVNTGFIVGGEATSEASSEKIIMVINKKTNKRKTIKAKVDIVAVTDYSGTILQ